jgi:tetratricopeptide (TPR) repeat protein
MNDQESVKLQLEIANSYLQILEQKKAGYSFLTVPAHLVIELESKQKEVDSLKKRLSLIRGEQSTSIPNNLPRPTSSIFVGREKEVILCLEALNKEQRWGIVIHGMGGIGKTELALEVATQAHKKGMFDAYLFVSAKASWLTYDGIRSNDNSFSSLEAFCEEFAKALGEQKLLQIKDSNELTKALMNSLRGRRTLLIWDNLETLTEKERERIADFLEELPPNNKAIVTSRVCVGDGKPILLNKLSKTSIFRLMDELEEEDQDLKRILERADNSARDDLYEVTGGNPLILKWTLGSLVLKEGYSLEHSLKRLKEPSVVEHVYTFLFSQLMTVLTERQETVLSVLAAFESSANLQQLMEITDLSEDLILENLKKLRNFALVTTSVTTSGDTYCLHPLTQNYVYEMLGLKVKMAGDFRTQLHDMRFSTAKYIQGLRYLVDYAKQHGHNYESFKYLDAEWSNLAATARTLPLIAKIPEWIKRFLKEDDGPRIIGPAIKKVLSILRVDESSKLKEELEVGVLSVHFIVKITKIMTDSLKKDTLGLVEENELTRGIYAAVLMVELASFLRKFLLYRGEWDRLINLNESAYNVSEGLQLSQFYPNAAWLAYDNAKIHQFRGNVGEAQKWLKRAIEQMEMCFFNKRLKIDIIRIKGEIAELDSEFGDPENLYLKALKSFRDLKSSRKKNDDQKKSNDEIGEANTLHVLGKLTAKYKDFRTANNYYRQAIEIYRRLQEDESRANTVYDLGLLALEMNQLEEASLHFKESLQLSHLLGYKYMIAKSQASLSEVFERQEKSDSEVLNMAREALKTHESLLSKELEPTRDLVDRLKKICE